MVRYFDVTNEYVIKYATYQDRDTMILLDTTIDPGLFRESVAREVVNRVQRLRKKVFYLLFGVNSLGLRRTIMSNRISRLLRMKMEC